MTYTLHLGDCLEYMKGMAPGSIDAVITDPPYGVNKAEWDSDIAQTIVWQECKRVLKESGSLLIFGGLRHMPCVIRSIDGILQYEWAIAWYKSNAMQFGKTGFNVLDLILWYSKGGAVASGKMRDVIEYPIIPSENDFGHPSPKPVLVMKKLANMVGGDTIFDPFMGSGTTGVACMQLGRNFIGCEIDPTYFAIAEKRIVAAASQMHLEGM